MLEITIIAVITAIALHSLPKERENVFTGAACWYQIRFGTAHQKFEVWRAEKPQTYCGTCSYATSLVKEMIFSYKMMVINGGDPCDELLEWLENLLNEFPPDYDPPNRGSFLY